MSGDMQETGAMPIRVESFFHKPTFTLTHLLIDEDSNSVAVVDPVLDYCASGARTSTEFIDGIIKEIEAQSLQVIWILETHVHADHLTGAQYLKQTLGGTIVIGSHVPIVQETFAQIYNEGPAFACDGSQFDRLVAEGEELELGNATISVMETPGHTPACVSYVCQSAVFVGDTLFAPDYGSARCDFPGGDAKTLYGSIAKLFALPGDTKLYLCHDYMPGGRDLMTHATVTEQKGANIHVGDGTTCAEFVAMRSERDKDLSTPELMLPAVQINMRAGHFPEAAENGTRYLKLPLNTF